MDLLLGTRIVPEVLAEYDEYARVVTIDAPGEEIISTDTVGSHLQAHDPDVLVIEATPIDDEVLAKSGRLKLIMCTRGNPANIDLHACKRRGIAVTNTPHRNANAVAEFTIALILSVMRRIPEAYMRLRNGEFTSRLRFADARRTGEERSDVIWLEDGLDTMPYFEFQGYELARKTLGVVGFGGIGRLVADMANRLGMNIVASDPYVSGEVPHHVRMISLGELIDVSDVVTLHAKESDNTIGMVNDEFLNGMKRGAFLINTGRGRLIDRDALITALGNGRLGGVALDVFDYEPLSVDDPLLTMDRVVCTPHIGGASKDVIFYQSRKTLESLAAFSRGESIPHRIV